MNFVQRKRPEIDCSRPSKVGGTNRTVPGAAITSALGDFRYGNTTVILPGFLAMHRVRA